MDMVAEQIEARGIRDPRVLRAMRAVPRHCFVPRELAEAAYSDHALPIGCGQTISQPYIVALMTEIIRPDAGSKVLEIGAGSGYQAAVLAELVREVFTVEIVPQLAQEARERLARAGYDNVRVKEGDGFHGWPEHAPFDAIVVTAAARAIPPPLVAQLRDGGRMILPLGAPHEVQELVLVTKDGDRVCSEDVLSVRFVPFTRAAAEDDGAAAVAVE